MRVQLTGTVEVSRPSHRRLLSILTLDAGRRIRTEVLIDRFWPDQPPDRAKAAIQTHMSALRRVLGNDAIATEGYGYRLAVGPDAVDALVFKECWEECRKAVDRRDWDRVLESADEALALWRGAPYEELTYDDFARPEIANLEEIQLSITELRMEAMLMLGREQDVVPDLERLAAAHPLRERLWEHLMMARYRLGRHSEALQAFAEVSERLAEVGLEPGQRLRDLEEKILMQDTSLNTAHHNLPPEFDSFIGRENEMRDLRELLKSSRLVTLTGPGGSGKTRLATHLSLDSLTEFPGGIWFVDLAGIDDLRRIPSAIAEAIGLNPGDDAMAALQRHLRGGRALIILDNCEHLEDGPAIVATTLLGGTTDLRILATSRSQLKAKGETVYSVPGLPTSDVAGPVETDAVRLFTQRASRTQPSSPLIGGDIEDVAAICAGLDGLPLAIELAAARSSSLGAAAVRRRLDTRFELLEGTASMPSADRHRSLLATVKWSYDLLDSKEKTVFDRLGVFRGGFDLEMAETVCVADEVPAEAIPSILSSLVESSLVVTYETSQTTRFRLLETLRHFALDRLAEHGDLDSVREQHRDWCLGFAETIWTALHSRAWEATMARTHLEFDNLNAAIAFSEEQGHAVATSRLLSAAAWHWLDLGYIANAVDYMERSLETQDDPEHEMRVRSRYASALFVLNQSDRTLEEARKAYELSHLAPPSPAKVQAIGAYANSHVILVDSDPERGIVYAREALETARATGSKISEVWGHLITARALAWSGHPEESYSHVESALASLPEVDHPPVSFQVYEWAMDTAVWIPGRRRSLQDYARRMLDLADEVGWEYLPAEGWISWGLLQAGAFERAEAVLNRRRDERHLEGFDSLGYSIPHGYVAWQKGDLTAAERDLADAEEVGLNPRWYHDFYPLKAEVAADRADLGTVRRSAKEYLDHEVHDSEAGKKVGVLHPLVRAEVEAALAADSGRDFHVYAAKEAFEKAETILRDYPPTVNGTNQIETHTTHLAFAQAELSRLERSDPIAWQTASDFADFHHYRVYAGFRLGEALIAAGDRESGVEHLRRALDAAISSGAMGQVRRIEETSARLDVTLS